MASINIRVLKANAKANTYLWFEWTLLYLLVPFLLRFWWRPQFLFAAFSVTTVAVTIWLLRAPKFDCRLFWRGNDENRERQQLKTVWQRFLICAGLIAAIVLLAFPRNFLDLPRETPSLWALVMIFYPLLSVYPQELIYRAFFFVRYQSIFPDQNSMVMASAATFGLIHIIFQNPIAISMTLVGGIFFAQTYARTRSLRLVWLEHSLHGCLIFTIGLGEFFSHGRIT